MWSLGVVLYEALAALSPFDRSAHVASLLAIVTEQPLSLELVSPQCPPPLREIVERALEKDLDDRWPTAAALREALVELRARAEEPQVEARARPRPRKSERRVVAVLPAEKVLDHARLGAALSSGTVAELRHVAVTDTLPRDCASTSCADFGAGIGIGAYLEAASSPPPKRSAAEARSARAKPVQAYVSRKTRTIVRRWSCRSWRSPRPTCDRNVRRGTGRVMRRAASIASIAVMSIGGCASSNTQGHEWVQPDAMWCAEMPFPLEARHSNGQLLVRAREVKGSSDFVEWTYFDRNGGRMLVEVQAPDGSLILTAYHPNGMKRFEGGFIYDYGRSEYWGSGPWAFFHEDGKTQASAELDSGKPVAKTMRQYDQTGKEMDWSMPEDAFIHHRYEVLYAKIRYPFEARRKGVGGEACDLICLDQEGAVTGFFPMNHLGYGLDEAVANSVKFSSFKPRRVGPIALPICFQLHFRFSQ